MDEKFRLPRGFGQTANRQTQLMQPMHKTAGGKNSVFIPAPPIIMGAR